MDQNERARLYERALVQIRAAIGQVPLEALPALLLAILTTAGITPAMVEYYQKEDG
jgi:hypothetical protein